jgi:sulfoxide reductase heme-binding subunit YedZ
MTITVLPDIKAHGLTWRPRITTPVVWGFRGLTLVPFVCMAPEVVSAIRHRPEAMANLSASVADVMGNAIFIVFVLMLAVTPTVTVTGWRWHVVLRRDLGIAMFALAWTDLTIAAIATGDEFEGGVLNRIAGHSFLLVGTLATAISLPLALTANRRAQRALGTYWKTIQRLTYVIWALILLHLLLLFGLGSTFVHAALVSVALLVPRLPAVQRWWARSRKAGTRPRLRLVAALALAAVFVIGLQPFVQGFARSGAQALAQQPVDD